MGLGLPMNNGGADRPSIIKYDGRAGRIHRIDRSNASGEWVTNEVEITKDFQAVMDLENIETGWLSFPAGGAPDIQTVKIGGTMPDRPSDKHKSGFRLLMKLGKSCGGDVREMASNAQVSIKGMDALYDAYLKDAGANAGKLPVVTLDDTLQVKSSGKDKDGKPQSSTNYQPVWKIVSWIDRPAELGGAASAAPAEPAKADPPKQEPAKELASVGEEF